MDVKDIKKVKVNIGCLSSSRAGKFFMRGKILEEGDKDFETLVVDEGVEVSEDPDSGAPLLLVEKKTKPKKKPKKKSKSKKKPKKKSKKTAKKEDKKDKAEKEPKKEKKKKTAKED